MMDRTGRDKSNRRRKRPQHTDGHKADKGERTIAENFIALCDGPKLFLSLICGVLVPFWVPFQGEVAVAAKKDG